VCRKLTGAGAQVRGLDIDWSHGSVLGEGDAAKRIDGDVRDRNTMGRVLRDEAIDTVIHLAAQAIVGPANEDPVETFEHNILGTWATLDACRRAPGVTVVVVASSDKAYGDHGDEPYEEAMALLGRHPYAASKTCADVLAQTYAESYGLPVGITRCGNMYGGGDTEWSRIVPGTIRSILRGERPVIRSDGSFVRDYLYVEDAADGVVALAEAVATRVAVAGEAFNFAADARLSVLEIVDRILRVMDSDLEPDVRNDALNEIPEQRVNAAKAHEVLGWRPSHSLDEALGRTVGWYRAYLGGDA
jgi:CDP-glucose 4,6-dehydratase